MAVHLESVTFQLLPPMFSALEESTLLWNVEMSPPPFQLSVQTVESPLQVVCLAQVS